MLRYAQYDEQYIDKEIILCQAKVDGRRVR